MKPILLVTVVCLIGTLSGCVVTAPPPSNYVVASPGYYNYPYSYYPYGYYYPYGSYGYYYGGAYYHRGYYGHGGYYRGGGHRRR